MNGDFLRQRKDGLIFDRGVCNRRAAKQQRENTVQFAGRIAPVGAFFAVRGIRTALAPRSISVPAVNPGPVDTEMPRDPPMQTVSAEVVAAQNLLKDLENDEAEISPDPTSRPMLATWKNDGADLEASIYGMHHGA